MITDGSELPIRNRINSDEKLPNSADEVEDVSIIGAFNFFLSFFFPFYNSTKNKIWPCLFTCPRYFIYNSLL
jgi:hypothetical protein